VRVILAAATLVLLHAGCTLVTCDDICDPKAGGAGGDSGGMATAGGTAGGATAGGATAGGATAGGDTAGGAAAGGMAGGDEPDGGMAGGAAGGATAGGAAGGAVVFVTNATYHGDFDAQAIGYLGVAAADRLCNLAATGAGMSASFRAYVSGPLSASNRLMDSSPWYLRGTSSVAFATKASLLGAPGFPINRNENGLPVTGTSDVWTGTTAGGLAGANCSTWSMNLMTQTGLKGSSSASVGWASSGAALTCDQRARLYCFEQR